MQHFKINAIIRNSLILIIVLAQWPLFAADKNQTIEASILESVNRHCPESHRESKEKIINMIIAKLPPRAYPEAVKAADLILPHACMQDYPAWLIDRTLNLAIYGVHEGKVRESTIVYLTEMIPSVSIGKIDYNEYGLLMEKMLDAGIPKDYIVDLYHSGLESNFSRPGVEALAYYYTKGLLNKKDHRESLKEAMILAVPAMKYGDRTIMLEFIMNDDPGAKFTPKRKTAEEIEDIEKKWEKFWSSHKGKIRQTEKYERPKTEASEEYLVQMLKTRAEIPYGYRLNRHNAIDITGIIAFITGEKTDNLPFSLSSYCQGGSVITNSRQLRAGDLMFFSTSKNMDETDVAGIYVADGEFLLITHSGGVEFFNLSDEYYSKRFKKGCRIFR